MAFFCPVRIRKNKKKHGQFDGNDLLADTNTGKKQLPPLGRITGSASIETLARVAFEKENGLSPNSKMIVLHDFTPCVDDELEVKCGQIINVLYQENDWLYVIAENTGNTNDNQQPLEGFIPTSYCAPLESNMDICNYKKKIPRNLPLNVNPDNTDGIHSNNNHNSNNLLDNVQNFNGLLDTNNNRSNNNFNRNQQFNVQQQTTAAIIHHQNNQLPFNSNNNNTTTNNNYCNDNVTSVSNKFNYPISSTINNNFNRLEDNPLNEDSIRFQSANKFTNNYYNHNQIDLSNCNRNNFTGNLDILNHHNHYYPQNNSKSQNNRLIDLPLTGKVLADDRTLVSNHNSMENTNGFKTNKIYELVVDYLREQQKQGNTTTNNNRANHPMSNIQTKSILDNANGIFGQIQPFIRQETHGQYVMLYKFMANNENDIDVGRGEIVTVLNKDDPDWLWVRRSDWKEGFVPIAYTCPLDLLSSS